LHSASDVCSDFLEFAVTLPIQSHYDGVIPRGIHRPPRS
jgi:hypothetical protein